jgi:hypothetical protein
MLKPRKQYYLARLDLTLPERRRLRILAAQDGKSICQFVSGILRKVIQAGSQGNPDIKEEKHDQPRPASQSISTD